MPNVVNFEFPGTKLSNDDFKKVKAELQNRYFNNADCLNWKGLKRPSWTEIKSEKTVVNLYGIIQQHIPKLNLIYIFIEFRREIYRCNYDQLIAYFDSKQPWVEDDLYIFTDEMNWLLISTHDSELLFAQ